MNLYIILIHEYAIVIIKSIIFKLLKLCASKLALIT